MKLRNWSLVAIMSVITMVPLVAQADFEIGKAFDAAVVGALRGVVKRAKAGQTSKKADDLCKNARDGET